MNLKFKIYSILFIAGLSASLCTGCSEKSFQKAYSFPAEGLSSLAVKNDEIKFKGFADELCVAAEDTDVDVDGVNAGAFGLFSLNDKEILSQHNIYEKVYPASTTKILTCLVALERGNLDDIVTVPESSNITVSGSSMADLQPGDTLTLRELLYAMMVPSGNDAAVAIAEHIGGDITNFAKLMNLEAKKLGATHSNFVNPHGLPDENHYTTVYDMYLIFNEAMKHDEFRKISRTKAYSCMLNTSEGSKNPQREAIWESGNGFYNDKFTFARNMQIVAGKTGHTSAAGFCLVLGEKADSGNEYISIIFNSPIYEQLYASMRTLCEKSSE